ncbi:MAG: trimeric intracellular cation channel family protein [Nitriliruptoraceae bacterium]
MEDVLIAVGAVTFAGAGALAAVRRGFDLVGIVILAFVTAIGGGSVRDLIVGIVPPTALTDEALLWLIFATALVVAALHRRIRTGRAFYVLDTAGLAVFAALGAERALSVGLGFWGTVFAGVLSGVGGGVIRDILSGEVPGILYRSGDFYASAAAVGAAVAFVAVPALGGAGLALAAGVTAALRVGSRLAGLELPVPRRGVDES